MQGRGRGGKVSCMLGWELGWEPPVGEQEQGKSQACGRAWGPSASVQGRFQPESQPRKALRVLGCQCCHPPRCQMTLLSQQLVRTTQELGPQTASFLVPRTLSGVDCLAALAYLESPNPSSFSVFHKA